MAGPNDILVRLDVMAILARIEFFRLSLYLALRIYNKKFHQ